MEPDVGRSKLDQLLAYGTESATHDYKLRLDLDSNPEIIEIAKDIGAMMVRGGHIVVGADNHGAIVAGAGIAAAHLQKFDEANFRGKLKKYLGTDFDLHTATHEVSGVHVGIVHVVAHPAGFLAFQADGTYPDPGDPKKTKTAFRAGDVYVRQGTASVRANQQEIQAIIREAARRQATQPSALTWTMSEVDFEDAVGAAFEEHRDVAIRRYLEEFRRETRRLLDIDGGSFEAIIPVLDRLTCFAALALRWNAQEWFEPSVKELVTLYESALIASGAPKNNQAVRLMMLVANRAYGLGAVAVSLQRWEAIPILVLQKPPGQLFESGFYTSWLNQVGVEAERKNFLSHTDSSGRVLSTSYLEVALLDIGAIGCLNERAPEVDELRGLLAQFDALATIAVYGLAPGDGDHPYWPWHRAYEPHRYEQSLVAVLGDDRLRQTIFPGDDRALATLLLQLQKLGTQHFSMFGGGYPYMADPIRVFLSETLDGG